MDFEFVIVTAPNGKSKDHGALIRSYAVEHAIRRRKRNGTLISKRFLASQARFLVDKGKATTPDVDGADQILDANGSSHPQEALEPCTDLCPPQVSLRPLQMILSTRDALSHDIIDPFVSLPVCMNENTEILLHHC
jgi:hypothetical protein